MNERFGAVCCSCTCWNYVRFNRVGEVEIKRRTEDWQNSFHAIHYGSIRWSIVFYLPLSHSSDIDISDILVWVMSLCEARKRTTSRFSFFIGTISRRHQNGVPKLQDKDILGKRKCRRRVKRDCDNAQLIGIFDILLLLFTVFGWRNSCALTANVLVADELIMIANRCFFSLCRQFDDLFDLRISLHIRNGLFKRIDFTYSKHNA